MYSISVFAKSDFLSVLQWLWSPSCPQGGILFSCADTFLQEILKPNHTHTHTHTHRPSIGRIQSLKRKQTTTGSGIWTSVHVELYFSHSSLFLPAGLWTNRGIFWTQGALSKDSPISSGHVRVEQHGKNICTSSTYLFLPYVRQTWRVAIVAMSQSLLHRMWLWRRIMQVRR